MITIRRFNTILLYIFVGTIIFSCNDSNVSNQIKKTEAPIEPTIVKPLIKFKLHDSPEIWHRKSHPRVLLDKEQLEMVINRMYGDNAREPYSRWFNLIKKSEDDGTPVDLVNLALIYKATNNPRYKQRFLDRLPKKEVPNLIELYGLDIMFDDLSDITKLSVMKRVANSKTPWYFSSIAESTGKKQAKWGYHDAIRVAPAFAYAAIFADTDLEKFKDHKAFPFNTKNYLKVVDNQLSTDGYFWKIENRIAGESNFNNALQGDLGGVYDNIGYDTSEESFSINLLLQHYVLTGEKRFENAFHDKYRAHFFQNMSVPHRKTKYLRKQSCRKINTESYIMAQIWNTQTSDVSQPSKNATAVTAFLYQDKKMQHYASYGIQRELCWPPFDGMFWELIYFDDKLKSSPPSDNATATYFSGPGIVTMRSDWTKDASFGVFMAGEGISRRYEDANSFLISRKTEVIPHAGARIRFNKDNMKHFWYHIRSASKNTLKVFDPNESFDINIDGSTGGLHSGRKLVDSDNLGGQIFEISPSTKDKCYNTYMQCSTGEKRKGDAFPLGIYETANVIKFEHKEGSYTYSVGDASAAYSKKVEYFEREFLFMQPDTFVIFDRVKSTNPKFKKVWTIHTVDKPSVDLPAITKGMGVSRYQNVNKVTIKHPKNHTHIKTLLPSSNLATIRGGDTTLIFEQSLQDIQPVTLDIPRWVELFVLGSDTIGTLVITGETGTEKNTTEVIAFDGKKQTYVTGRPTKITNSRLYDKTAMWKENQWLGYQLSYRHNQKTYTTIIKGNSTNELFGDLYSTSSYKYSIERPFANSYKHWKKIKTITTTDMDIKEIRVTVPHYFDTVDAKGRLHSFSPHTDFKDDNYRKRPDLGQWTIEVQASKPRLLDNFAHVIALKDPNQSPPTSSVVENVNNYGLIIEDQLILFSKERATLKKLTFTKNSKIRKILATNLMPLLDYYLSYNRENNLYTLTSKPGKGERYKSSNMGIAIINVRH
ncbi:MAG: hypothetical protein ACI9EK_001741 [Psychroserpens sp.]|jgi:hypothetical protein